MTYLLPQTYSFFFFNDTATTEIYTLSLHDALPISTQRFIQIPSRLLNPTVQKLIDTYYPKIGLRDRKSTRLNSSHQIISYAVFCLKKKKHHHSPHHLPLPAQLLLPPHTYNAPSHY